MRIRRKQKRHLGGLRTAAVAAGLFAVGCTCVHAQALLLPADASANLPRDLYLEVDLNGQRTSLIAHFRESNGRLSATGRDLSDIGLAIDRLGIAGTAEVRLDAIAGLRYHYDAARQAIVLRV